MDIPIPQPFFTPEDPRRFYKAMSNEIVSRILQASFSVLELSPGPNANPMNFLSASAGKRISSYRVAESSPANRALLESNRRSRNLLILNTDPKEALEDIYTYKSSCDLLLLSGLQPEPIPGMLKRAAGKVPFIAIYTDNERLQPIGNRTENLSSALKGYEITSFSFPERAPSLFFAAQS